ncbi:MAG: diguanylate cyclase [Anaerostipes sp.]|nr:diguanylate cyclase [Anaerostipes sp.]
MNTRKKKHLGTKQIIIIVFATILLFMAGVSTGRLSAVAKPVEENAGYKEQVSLTDKEKAYQKKHPTIVVAADASWRPLEYTSDENGQYAGVIAQILGRLGNYTGFKIEYMVKDSYAAALKAVQSGEADVISGLAYDKNMAKEYSVNLSNPYLMINSAIVSKGDVSGLYNSRKSKKIAVVDGDYANAEIQKDIKNVKLVKCSSNEECLQKVKDNQVDMAIVASYCAEYYMSVPKYSALKSHTITDFSWQLAFGISTKENPMLVQILNKGIDKMGHLDMNEAVYEGVVNATYDNNLMLFVYRHPILVISVVLGIVLMIAVLLLVIFVEKKKEHMRQVEDGTRLKMALERTHLCIWEIDLANGQIGKIDNEQEPHGFYDLREGIPESAIKQGYVHPDDISVVREAIRKIQTGETNVQGCWRIKQNIDDENSSTYWWEQVRFRVVFDEKNRPIKAIGVSEDITKEKDAQWDSLTAVYNRSSFERKANIVLNERRNAHLQCAFLILDLDGFKKINDTYGHGMGDRVLISVGATLNKIFRTTDIVGRLGGDEFTIFMTSIRKKEDVVLKAEEVVENIGKLREKEGFPFFISCSLGVVVGTKGQEELAVLYKKADTALYKAKHEGKNCFKIYQ